MKIQNLLFISFIFLLFSCNSSSKSELDTLFDDLVVAHDVVMPKTMAISSISKKMYQAVEGASEEAKEEAEAISAQLSDVEERMNNWMVEFSEAIEGEESLQKEKYLKLQDEIEILKKDTDNAINSAKKLTEKLSK